MNREFWPRKPIPPLTIDSSLAGGWRRYLSRCWSRGIVHITNPRSKHRAVGARSQVTVDKGQRQSNETPHRQYHGNIHEHGGGYTQSRRGWQPPYHSEVRDQHHRDDDTGAGGTGWTQSQHRELRIEGTKAKWRQELGCERDVERGEPRCPIIARGGEGVVP